METNNIKHCCGVQEIGNFSGTTAEIKSYLQNKIVDFKYDSGMLIATTTPNQKYAIAALKATGFVKRASARNNNTNNVITLWSKSLNPGKSLSDKAWDKFQDDNQ